MLIGSDERGYLLSFETREVRVSFKDFKAFEDDLKRKVIVPIEGLRYEELGELLANILPKLFPQGTASLTEADMMRLTMRTNQEILKISE